MSTPLRSIHVMAAVITDARGRILLARRTEGRDLAGRWEFPGGKLEPGETPEDALVRELREELGIEARVGEHLISVPQQYPDKRLCLEVRQLTGWSGTPRGHEGQALVWVPADKLTRYDMPPADRPVVAALLQPDRYLVTPEPEEDEAAPVAPPVRSEPRTFQQTAPVGGPVTADAPGIAVPGEDDARDSAISRATPVVTSRTIHGESGP